jgi:hypothetical protein
MMGDYAKGLNARPHLHMTPSAQKIYDHLIYNSTEIV